MHEQLNVMMHAPSIEFLTKTPKILKNHLFNLKKIWSIDHITHNRIQFIMIKDINPTSQFYQFGPNWTKSPIRIHTSPRNFNFSKFTKLIKLNHQDQVHNIQEQKLIDQFQKIWLESSKIPNLHRFKNLLKNHEFMHENM